MAIMDSICAVKSRQENLRRSLQDQKARRDKCAAIVSQELIGMPFISVFIFFECSRQNCEVQFCKGLVTT